MSKNKKENKNIYKKRIIRDICMIIAGIAMLVGFIYFGVKDYDEGKKDYVLTDSEKFSTEYNSVAKDNVFVYRNAEEIINILNGGTGVVYLGFPECPWCNYYVNLLNSYAKSTGIEKIYYLDILEDRKNNTPEYKEIVSILKNYLDNDDEGNKRIYVPEVIFVNEGKIIGHDNETANGITSGDTPENYWTVERLNNLNYKLTSYMNEIISNKCTTCD